MKYKMSELYAYRFYEKKDGPFISLVQFNREELLKIGNNAGIINIDEIYTNRKRIEELMYKLFIRQGGIPQFKYPYYAAVYDELPKTNQLHVRFSEPECIKIPMYAFSKKDVSFTYCQSPRAFTRKDNHPTHRKLFMWDEAEKVINQYPFCEIEDTWIEMQIWNDDVLKDYYENNYGENIQTFQVIERLSENERHKLIIKYEPYLRLIKPEYFFSPLSAHGINHATRVLVLAQELAIQNNIEEYYKKILLYCAAYHDIGRKNHEVDNKHGYISYQKIVQLGLFPNSFKREEKEILRFIIENHQINILEANKNIKKYLLTDREKAYLILKIFKDADTLDRCRFGYVDRYYLCLPKSQLLLHFAFQLLKIYKEII